MRWQQAEKNAARGGFLDRRGSPLAVLDPNKAENGVDARAGGGGREEEDEDEKKKKSLLLIPISVQFVGRGSREMQIFECTCEAMVTSTKPQQRLPNRTKNLHHQSLSRGIPAPILAASATRITRSSSL